MIRADAGLAIGSGHVMRCLALGEEWVRRGGRAVFALAEGAARFGERIRASGIETISVDAAAATPADAERTAALARGAAWIALDGYRFGADYLATLRGAARILLLDDAGSDAAGSADAVLNQNLHAVPELYAGYRRTPRLLLGPEYLLLRREFVDRRVRERETPDVARRVLVTLGGSDAENHTARVLEALARRAPDGTEVVATVGAASPHAARVEELARAMRPPARVVRDAPDMAAIMERSEAAVCSGGTTVWELAYMRVPTLVGTTVPVEELLLGGLVARGFRGGLGALSSQDPEVLGETIRLFLTDAVARREAAGLGATLVDGRGASRVVDAMTEESGN